MKRACFLNPIEPIDLMRIHVHSYVVDFYQSGIQAMLGRHVPKIKSLTDQCKNLISFGFCESW